MAIDYIQQIDFSFNDWKFYAPLVITILGWIGAIWAWIINERRKRRADQYQRKEASYRELLRSLIGFYKNAENAEIKREEFLNQLNLAWLYCPDEIIRKGYAFIDTVHTDNISADKDKEKALGEFVAAIRNDLISRKLVSQTSLTSKDFRILLVNHRQKKM